MVSAKLGREPTGGHFQDGDSTFKAIPGTLGTCQLNLNNRHIRNCDQCLRMLGAQFGYP